MKSVITKNQDTRCSKCGAVGTVKNNWICHPKCKFVSTKEPRVTIVGPLL